MESRSFYQAFDVLAVSPRFILHFIIGSTSLSLQGDSLKREIGDKGDSPQSELLSRCPEQSVRQQVENMNHNLLSVGQMCDQGHTILFNSTKCEIGKGMYGVIVATTSRAPNDIYVLDEATKGCLIVKEDDTIIGSNNDRLSKKFATKVQSDFEMSLLGELTYFLGLQISQQEKGMFIC